MKRYIVKCEYEGYSRGVVTYEVEAESEEDAKENWWAGEEIERRTTRDDSEKEPFSVKEKPLTNKDQTMKIGDNFGSNQLLKDVVSQSHMIDIRVRLNGQYYWFEGDFLKDVLPAVEFERIEYEFTATLEDHKEKALESEETKA